MVARRSGWRGLAGIAAGALAGLFLAGCAPPGSLADVRRQGVLVVGIAPDYPPFAFRDPSGAPAGLEPELAAELARGLGVQLKLVEGSPGELLARLARGEVHVVLAALLATEERQQTATFTEPYFAAATGLVVRDEAGAASTLDDLAGATVGVLLVSAEAALVEPHAGRVQRYVSVAEAALDLVGGRLDALTLPWSVAEALPSRYPELKLAGELVPAPGVAAALRHGNRSLAGALDSVLAGLAEQGRLQALVTRWFGLD